MATRRKTKLSKNNKLFIGIFLVIMILMLALIAANLAGKTETSVQTPGTNTPAAPAASPAATPAAAPNETSTAAFTFPSGIAPPSLKIVSFINTPTFPKVGEVALIKTYVKNVGSDSAATTATLKINGQNITTMNVPALQRNAQIVLQYNYTVPAKGDYVAEIKVIPVPGETIFDDNTADITFIVY